MNVLIRNRRKDKGHLFPRVLSIQFSLAHLISPQFHLHTIFYHASLAVGKVRRGGLTGRGILIIMVGVCSVTEKRKRFESKF